MSQQFKTVDVLRLEVEDDPEGLVNLVQNPSGELGGWGWATPVAGSSLVSFSGSDGSILAYRTSGGPTHLLTEPMPVTEGQYVAASWESRQVFDGLYHRARFVWLDAAGAVLSSTTQSDYFPDAVATINYGPHQAPAGTVHVQLRYDVYADDTGAAPGPGNEFWFTQVTVAKADAPGDLGNVRVNLVPNPSFEADAKGWARGIGCTLARSTAEAHQGTASLAVTGDGTNPQARFQTAGFIPVEPHASYTVSFHTKAATTPRPIGAFFNWYDADGVQLQSSGATLVLNSTSEWTLRTQTRTAPSEAAYLRLNPVIFDSAGDVPPGEVHYFDGFLLEKGDLVGAYFDGDTPNVSDTTYSWGAHPAKVVTRRNLVKNPSFETNANHWPSNTTSTVSRFTGEKYVGSASLQVSQINAGNVSHVLCDPFDVTVGTRYYARAMVKALTVTATRQFSVGIRWYDAAENFLTYSSTAVPVAASWTSVGTMTGFVAPADAAKGRLWVRLMDSKGMVAGTRFYLDAAYVSTSPGDYFDGSTPGSVVDYTTIEHAWDGTANGSTSTRTETTVLPFSTATSSNLAYIEPVPFLNVLGPTHDIKVNREALNVGTLTATVLDANLDPSQSTLIRPGKRVRLLAQVSDDLWAPIGTTKASQASVSYHLKDPGIPEVKRARIELTAPDNTAALANTQRTEGVATIDELPYVLEGCGVPWNVNGSGNQVPTATVVARNESASALDQIAITRDSNLGYAWVDRHGMVHARNAPAMSTVVRGVLDDTVYSSLDISYNTEDCINEVSIKFLRLNPSTGETEEVVYGPYRDEASISEWGVRSAEFTIQDVTEDPAVIEAFALAILYTNAQPVVRINSVTVPIATPEDVAAYALLDLYDLVQVANAQKGIDELSRITSIEHSITPEKWLVTFGFSADGIAAAPTFTPSPGVGAGGKTIGQLLRPVGEVTMWFGLAAEIPAGWLLCNGGSFDAETYPALAELLGGTTLPNLVDRFPIGAGTKAVGSSGGSPTQTLAIGNLPSHSHGSGTLTAGTSGSTHSHMVNRKDDAGNSSGFAQGDAVSIDNWPTETDGAHSHNVTGSTGNTGSGTAFDIMPPWRALHFIIRAI